MTGQMMASLVSAVLIAGNVTTSAVSAPFGSNVIQAQIEQTAEVLKNASPLPPGRAAGIKQAQGYEGYTLDAVIAITAVVIIVLLLLDTDEFDETSTSTTGT
jgi:hypothetical protein